jgi:hypothetical protein
MLENQRFWAATSPPRDDRGARAVAWILRVGVCACFVGHGVFGLLAKPAWLAYFAALGIDPETALQLMPLVGALDIAVGIAALVRPIPPVLAWAALWGMWTALLRPLAGESVWETLERAGNYGAPLALLLWLAANGDGGAGPPPRSCALPPCYCWWVTVRWRWPASRCWSGTPLRSGSPHLPRGRPVCSS